MAEITTSSADRAAKLPLWCWLLAIILGLTAYFAGLSLPLFGPDEPRYAQVAREMFERGDWITPTLAGHTWFEKPVLAYWLQIVSFSVFGVSEFASRLGPAFCGLVTIGSMWMLGRRAVGITFANWLALVTASTLGILVFAHGQGHDIVLTAAITGSLTSFFIYDVRRSETGVGRFIPLVLFYVFVGLALLAKGLVGIVFPFTIVGAYHLIRRRMPSGDVIFSIGWGTILALAVASFWYLPAYSRHGWEFVDEFIIQHHFQRFTSNKYQHPQPFFFFWWVLPLMTLPWMPMFLGAIFSRLKEWWRYLGAPKKPDTELPRDLAAFALVWMLVPIVFFSFSGSKLPGYILPAVPPAIVIAMHSIYRMVRTPVGAKIVFVIACLVFTISSVLLWSVVPRYMDFDSAKGFIAAANDRGYTNEPLYGLHTRWHRAEFYATSRLLRDPAGEQKILYGPAEVVTEMERGGVARALVFVPNQYLYQLEAYYPMKVQIIKANSEITLALVERAN